MGVCHSRGAGPATIGIEPQRTRPLWDAGARRAAIDFPVGPDIGLRRTEIRVVAAALALRCINRFTAPGMPGSVRIA